jgi:hypothetical protein
MPDVWVFAGAIAADVPGPASGPIAHAEIRAQHEHLNGYGIRRVLAMLLRRGYEGAFVIFT